LHCDWPGMDPGTDGKTRSSVPLSFHPRGRRGFALANVYWNFRLARWSFHWRYGAAHERASAYGGRGSGPSGYTYAKKRASQGGDLGDPGIRTEWTHDLEPRGRRSQRRTLARMGKRKNKKHQHHRIREKKKDAMMLSFLLLPPLRASKPVMIYRRGSRIVVTFGPN